MGHDVDFRRDETKILKLNFQKKRGCKKKRGLDIFCFSVNWLHLNLGLCPRFGTPET